MAKATSQRRSGAWRRRNCRSAAVSSLEPANSAPACSRATTPRRNARMPLGSAPLRRRSPRLRRWSFWRYDDRPYPLADKDLVAGSGGYRRVAPITSSVGWVAGTGLIWFEDLKDRTAMTKATQIHADGTDIMRWEALPRLRGPVVSPPARVAGNACRHNTRPGNRGTGSTPR